jgi:ATP-binding cassette subfamily C protein LapB
LISRILRDLQDGLVPARLRRVIKGPGKVLFLTGALSNVITILVSLFALLVYDKVFPHDGTATLIALSVITLAFLGLDTGLRFLRSNSLERALFEANENATAAQVRSKFVTLSNAKNTGEKGYFEEAVDTLTKIQPGDVRTATLMVDLPFVLMILVAIFLIAGVLVFVPLLAMLAMLIVTAVSLDKGKQAMAQAEADKRSGLQQIALATQGTDWFFGMGGWRWIQAVDNKVRTAVMASAAQVSSVNSLRQISTQQISQLITICTVFFGFYLFRNGHITVGGVIATSLLASRCLAPLGNLAQLSSASAKETQAAEVDAPVEIPAYKSSLRMPVSVGNDWSIQFDKVEFVYPGRSKPSLVLDDLKINAGEKIALLGRSGSGKSTLVKLLAGSLKSNTGTLSWKGLPLSQIAPDDWENFCVYVPQVPWMGAGSLFDQIRLGRDDITDDQIGEALESLGLSGIGQSANNKSTAEGLSTGQIQMLGLARSLVRSGELLILDEPTNSLDTESEQLALKAILERYKAATVILITHKKNLLGLVDKAIVMESGQVRASGPIQRTNTTVASS